MTQKEIKAEILQIEDTLNRNYGSLPEDKEQTLLARLEDLKKQRVYEPGDFAGVVAQLERLGAY